MVAGRQYEGLVDTYLNRIIGQPLTKLFIRYGMSANAVTVLSAGTGLLAAASFATLHYAMGLLGALLFQLAAVLDCCDGDVARQTGTQSEWGARLDLYSDYLSYAAVFVAIGWRVSMAEANFSACLSGIVAAVASGLIMWRLNKSTAAPLVLPDVHRRLVSAVATRDFSILLLPVALADLFGLFIKTAAFGTTLFWLYSLYVVPASHHTANR